MRRSIFIFALVAVSLISFAAGQSQICQALVLQGGGDKGSYQAGVLWSLINNAKDPNNVKYDVVTGISAGAINAVAVGMYQIGDEVSLANFLNNTWRSLKRQDVYYYWTGGYIDGILFRTSLVDNSPLRTTLSKLVTVPLYRRVSVGATDANTGTYVNYTEKDFGSDVNEVVDAIIASSSIPVFFPFQSKDDYNFIDGGITRGFDFPAAVNRCLEIVPNQSQIVVDVILTSNNNLANVEVNDYNAVQMLIRYLEIYAWKYFNTGLINAKADYPDVKIRYLISPSQTLPNNLTPIDFKPKNIDFMIKIGVQDGLTAIQEGEGVAYQRYLEEAIKYYESMMV